MCRCFPSPGEYTKLSAMRRSTSSDSLASTARRGAFHWRPIRFQINRFSATAGRQRRRERPQFFLLCRKTDATYRVQRVFFLGIIWCAMPRYFFSLNHCLPPPQAVEELPDDEAARALAMTVAAEFGRNRQGRTQECIIVLNERGQLIHKAWTSSDCSD